MQNQEIGSEFWNAPVGTENNKVFPEHTQWYLSGRSALKAIIKDLNGAKTLAMPSWCCDSMVKPFADAGIEVHFYPIYKQDRLVQEIKLESDVLFLMDYFGYSYGDDVKHPCIIRDVTHSLFSAVYTDADYCFGSLRKWCGVWTGGYAWTKNGCQLPIGIEDDNGYVDLRQKAMAAKSCYLSSHQNSEGKALRKKSYLALYNKAEETLEGCGISPSVDRDILIAKRLDVDFIRYRRRSNARILMDAFHEQLIFPVLRDTDCPMFVPILVPEGKRDMLQCYLIQHKIYCPIHWPISSYHKLDETEMDIYKNELSLVCDQRYKEEDMNRIVETIKKFWKEG